MGFLPRHLISFRWILKDCTRQKVNRCGGKWSQLRSFARLIMFDRICFMYVLSARYLFRDCSLVKLYASSGDENCSLLLKYKAFWEGAGESKASCQSFQLKTLRADLLKCFLTSKIWGRGLLCFRRLYLALLLTFQNKQRPLLQWSLIETVSEVSWERVSSVLSSWNISQGFTLIIELAESFPDLFRDISALIK